jgi:hypothetical protein
VKGHVLPLRVLNCSYSMIVKTLEEQRQKISKSAVSSVLKNPNNGVESPSVNGLTEKKQRRPTVRTFTNIKVTSVRTIHEHKDIWHDVCVFLSAIINRDSDMHRRMKPKITTSQSVPLLNARDELFTSTIWSILTSWNIF